MVAHDPSLDVCIVMLFPSKLHTLVILFSKAPCEANKQG